MIDQEKAKEIYEDLKLALAQLAIKHGITFGPLNCKYGDNWIEFKSKADEVGGPTKEESDYDHTAKINGWPKRGTTFEIRGNTYTITGLNTRARKNKLLFSKDGQQYHGPLNLLRDL